MELCTEASLSATINRQFIHVHVHAHELCIIFLQLCSYATETFLHKCENVVVPFYPWFNAVFSFVLY